MGVSERTFRRMRGGYEAEGTAGLADRRVGKPSPHRIGADEAARVVALYRERYLDWSVKHFHERAQSVPAAGGDAGFAAEFAAGGLLARDLLPRLIAKPRHAGKYRDLPVPAAL